MRQILITVAGRNSAGKSLIAKKVAEALGLNVVKSYATRKPRPEELKKGLENCDHIFVSDEEYDKLENITAETEINGARYCTTQEVLDNSDIYVIDPKGIKDLKERCGSRYKILQFYIYADADKRAARFVARGETKAKFAAREQSEDEQFCNYENNHGWDIIIYNNWDIDTAAKTMLGYVRPIMTPVIEARQKQAEEEFEKMMNPPAEEKVEDAPADEQAGMKEQQEEEPKAEDEQTDDVPADEVPDKEAGDKNCQEEAEDEQVEDVSDKEMDDVGEQTEEPEEEKSETEESPAEDGEELEECQQEDASDDSSEASASTEANDDPFSLDFDDEDEDFMNIPAGVDAESDESDGADVDNDEDSADENNSDAADPFSLDDFDDTDKEDTDSSDEPEKPEEREEPDEEPDNVPEEESEPIEEHVDKSTSEPADENPDNASEIHEEPEESSDDEENDDDGEAILID
mgnify:CR=1 FL=1